MRAISRTLLKTKRPIRPGAVEPGPSGQRSAHRNPRSTQNKTTIHHERVCRFN